ncbi:hypothetical protein [Mucilaginibacter sp. SP1R1]|uniref:hypothetical protein n=1 Tax=Mucilaginibacter sp. SP1R1 TaxID=2723091 RepID=UPI00351C2EFA
MMPTFCNLLSLKTTKDIDGLSILPTMQGKGRQVQHEYLYYEYPEYGGHQNW